MHDIDWRQMFMDYAQHVAECEGTDFLGGYDQDSDLVEFTRMTSEQSAAVKLARDEARVELQQRNLRGQ
jgi:hypothetical protein